MAGQKRRTHSTFTSRAKLALIGIVALSMSIWVYYSSTNARAESTIIFLQFCSLFLWATGSHALIRLWQNFHLRSVAVPICLLLCLYFFVVVSSYDTGAKLSSNQHRTMFVVLFSVMCVFFGTAYVTYRYKIIQLKTAVYLLFAIFLFLLHRSHSAKAAWRTGLFGETFNEQLNHCIIRPSFPWRLLFPRRTFNFFTGFESCGNLQTEAISALSSTGTLTSKCKAGLEVVRRPNFFADVRNYTFLLNEFQGTNQVLPRLASNSERGRVEFSVQLPEDEEWVRTFCGNQEDFHLEHRRKSSVLQRKQRTLGSTNWSILVIMIDAVSRAEFHRGLPATARTLEKIHRKGNAKVFEFFRYHSVGHNTKPNLTPLITGLSIEDYEDLLRHNNHKDQPGCFWNWFRELGYATAFLNGQCADYLQLFWQYAGLDESAGDRGLDHDIVLPFCHPDYNRHFEQSPTLNGPYSIRRRCIANRAVHTYMLNYLKGMINNYRGRGKVAFASFLEAHEGTLEVLPTMDKDLSKFLEELHNDEVLDDTVQVIMADHGNHMSPWYYFFKSGEMERSLPALFLVVPREFLDQNPEFEENLRANKHKLVTVFDLYATFHHIRRLVAPRTDDLSGTPSKRMPRPPPSWSKSLFEPISAARDCETTHIESLVCMCNKE